MKFRQILIIIVILGTVWHTAAAQPKKKNVQPDALPPESILAGTSVQCDRVGSESHCAQTRKALGPTGRSQILRNRHEHGDREDIGRFLCNCAGPTSKSNYPGKGRISAAAELPMAMMQYQVLSALHDVLKHDIDEAAEQQARPSLKKTSSDTVLVVPFPGSAPASR